MSALADAEAGGRRRRIQRAVEKYLSNPGMRMALRAGVAPRSFALLETVGNTTGRRRLTPVGNGLQGTTFWLVSELGTRSAYVRNMRANPRVRVKVGRRWFTGTAVLVPEDDGWARREDIDRRNGLVGRFDGAIFRASATDPVTVRIDIDPTGAPARSATRSALPARHALRRRRPLAHAEPSSSTR